MDLLNPEITYAWGNLRHFYDLKGEHRVYFRYVGDNCFHINVYMESTSQIMVYGHFAKAERREPLTNGHFQHFFVTLSFRQTQSNYLVTFYFCLI